MKYFYRVRGYVPKQLKLFWHGAAWSFEDLILYKPSTLSLRHIVICDEDACKLYVVLLYFHLKVSKTDNFDKNVRFVHF